jgi:U6 snRNA-associated Sm-like protein LSm4
MNLTLKDVIQSSANGEDFLKIPEIYIRGIHIKYLRLPEEVRIKRIRIRNRQLRLRVLKNREST